ncbi:MAG: tRNA pseudouridine(13) synthase TruD [archaeon YNP-LCB-024-027]|jgi:tRNA pseudouridine13 synthase|nr:tRNA pseudouridine(13) synthase TruD [Candidatus Culexarchaeum yellowstonense]
MFDITNSEIDQEIGLKYYATPKDVSIENARIRDSIDEFIIQEVLRGGIILPKEDVSNFTIPLFGEGEYLRMVLVKKGVDTLYAISKLSKKMKIPISDIQFLGLKDSKGIAIQSISMKCKNGVNLNKINETISGIRILRWYRSYTPLCSHELWGNRFTVIIKVDDRRDETSFITKMAKIQKIFSLSSIFSYFGYQRFGMEQPFNHIIGKKILNRNYDEALQKMFEKGNCDTFNGNKEIWEEEVRNVFSKNIEVVRIFLQSYQSFLFNKMINKRIEEGIPLEEAINGDLVGPVETTLYREEDIIEVTENNKDKVNYLIKRGVLSVLYPLPGYLTDERKIPRGEAYEPIAKVLDEERVVYKDFLFKEFPEISLAGYYRPLKFRVYNFMWHLTKDGNIHCNFLLKKGNYATIVLREIVKPKNPSKVGF